MENRNRSQQDHNALHTATLGGGCFWCLEPVFEDLQGVVKVVVGYAGGETQTPNYHQVSAGMTGHAEVVQISFDPRIITYREVLEVFFSVHDPTTLNRQGADAGTQYRSIILYHDEAQKETAEKTITDFTQERLWKNPIVTEVKALEVFYMGEEYHQEYYKKNPYQGYCAVVIAPKVAKFRKKFSARLKSA